MAEVSVEISPPKPSTPYHSLLPKDYLKSSMECINDLQNELRTQKEASEARFRAVVAKFRTLEEAETSRQDEKILKLGLTNMLTRFIEVLHDRLHMNLPEGGVSNTKHSMQRYKAAAEGLKSVKHDRYNEATGNLPVKYLTFLIHKYSLMVDERNDEAHESEVTLAKLAKLLVTPRMKDHPRRYYDQWAPLFQFVYGTTVEEFAEAAPSISFMDMIAFVA